MTTTLPQRRRYGAVAAMIAAFTLMVGLACASAQPPPPPPTQSMFGDSAPARPADPETKKVEIGTRFTVSKDGLVTAIRFYKGDGNTGTHVGKLYAGNREVARVTFRNETGTGWQTATLNAAVAVKPGTTYTASYVAPRGKYASDERYAWPKVSGDLTATGGFYRYPEGYPTQQWNRSNYYVDVLFAANTPAPPTTTTVPPVTTTEAPPTTTEPAPTTTTEPPATTTTTTPAPTGCQGAQHTPGGPDGKGGCWPGLWNTGPKTTPTQHVSDDGPNDARLVLTDNQVLENVIIDDSIYVAGENVVIRNSIINGWVEVVGSITIEDSELHGQSWEGGKAVPWVGASIGWTDYTLIRTEVTGSATPLLCEGCTLIDSYTHDPAVIEGQHSSGFGSNGNGGNLIDLRHNTLHCTSPQQGPPSYGGCTSDLALIADFHPVDNVTIDNNLLPATPSGGYCATFGYNEGKPFAEETKNVRVTNNVFGRGPTGKCGVFGAVTSFKPGPGSVWDNNRYDDGEVISQP